MLKSMTGFGRASKSFAKRDITVELRCVNHRYLECSVRAPRAYGFLEEGIKSRIQKSVARGKLDVGVLIVNTAEQEMTIEPNMGVVKGYYKALKAIEEELGLPESQINALSLSRFPDSFRVTGEDPDEEEIAAEVYEVLAEAVDAFIAMRETEGAKLRDDILSRIAKIEEMVEKIESFSGGFLARYTDKLYQRIKAVLENTEIDEARILTEAAIYADKSAVDEETVRLRSHCGQFRSILASGEPVGRKLDFLIQELNREANTIGSKSSELELTGIVVDIKAEIEKIREQIQNVE